MVKQDFRAQARAYARQAQKIARQAQVAFARSKKAIAKGKEVAAALGLNQFIQQKSPQTPARQAPKASKMRQSTPQMLIRRRLVRRGGASHSKSAGKFKAGRFKTTEMDKMQRAGAVCAFERGGIIVDTAAPYTQSALVGHATYTVDSIRATVALALTRLCASKMKIQITNWNQVVKATGQGNMTYLLYKQVGLYTAPAAPVNLIVNAGTDTWLTVSKWFYDQLVAAKASEYWTSLRIVDAPGTGGSGTYPLAIDLMRCRFKMAAKSSLKLQNRTVNVSGNADDNDVDNVPLYGKSYEGAGNFNVAKTSAFGATGDDLVIWAPKDASQSLVLGTALNRYWVPLDTQKYQAGSPFAEPQPSGMLVRRCKLNSAKLDPGEIKTSVLYDTRTISMNKLLQELQKTDVQVTITIGTAQSADIPVLHIGKYRYFHFEKMIQAIATDAEKSIRIAYECDYKIGCVAYAPQSVSYPLMRYDQTPV